MTQPWSNQSVSLIIITGGGPGTGFFLYNGAPGPGNPPVLWAVPPGVTADPFGTPVAAVLGAGNPGGANTQIDAAGDVTLTGTGGVTLQFQPSANLPFSLTTAFTGVMQSLILAGSGDGNQTQPGVISGITLGTGATAKMGTLITSPYGTTGTGILLQAQNDGATDVASMVAGTVTTQGGTLTFTPLFAVLPGALLAYSGTGTLTVVTKTTGSGTIPIPLGVSVGVGEAWGHGQTALSGSFLAGINGVGGSEYAAEPALALTPGGTASYVVGGVGASSTLTGSAVTVTAHPGLNNGNPGTGSANTVHFDGGNAGVGSTGGGGGGGGGGGPGGPGHNGSPGTGSAGGNGGAGASGAGSGGRGGAPGGSGTAGGSPGGGGGGGGKSGSGAVSGGGQVRLTYSSGAPALLWSVATAAGTDQFGTAYQAGERVVSADGNTYRTERLIQFTASPITFSSTSAATILSCPVGIGTYRVRCVGEATQGATAAVQNVRLSGPASSAARIQCNTWTLSTTGQSVFASAAAVGADLNLPATAATNNFYVEIEAIVTFTAAGTLIWQGRAPVAANTWTMASLAYMEVNPI